MHIEGLQAQLSAATGSDVSRETCQQLLDYAALLERWTRKINLIGPGTVGELWTRHIIDSAQLLSIDVPAGGSWYDIGSGGGLPGVVIAVLARDSGVTQKITLVESDARKAAFLQTARRELGLDVEVLAERVETLSGRTATILSARAFAPLDRLLASCESLISTRTVCLLPKGKRYLEEISAARATWDFTAEITPSITDPDAAILRLGGITRAPR